MSQAVVAAAVMVMFAAVVTAGPMKLYQKTDDEKFRHGKFFFYARQAVIVGFIKASVLYYLFM